MLTLAKMWRPFTFLSLPVVVYSGFAYGCTVVWALLTSGTSSLVLSSPPYNFKASIVGLFSVASLLGCIVGYVPALFHFMKAWILTAQILVAVSVVLWVTGSLSSSLVVITVYLKPRIGCGCTYSRRLRIHSASSCGVWVLHMLFIVSITLLAHL